MRLLLLSHLSPLTKNSKTYCLYQHMQKTYSHIHHSNSAAWRVFIRPMLHLRALITEPWKPLIHKHTLTGMNMWKCVFNVSVFINVGFMKVLTQSLSYGREKPYNFSVSCHIYFTSTGDAAQWLCALGQGTWPLLAPVVPLASWRSAANRLLDNAVFMCTLWLQKI